MKTTQPLSKFLIVLFLATLSAGSITAQDLETRVDALLTEQYPTDGPGATALIAKDGKVIYRKAFGMANLELGVPMKPENVFEIGSITKQFTAVSILMLEEQGKLNIEDEITKFIPDYPTHGKKITIHELLNHTSGIKSYTDLPDLRDLARKDLEPLELIDVFKDEPMDFDPGTEYRYNNSGYILLGYIIEKVSGMSYADFVQKNIFDKVGMTSSYYGSKTTLIPNRASGYMPSENGYRNADYLSMTLPYAAGSIMSTVDDLLKWQNAITANELISEASKKKAHTGYDLTSGDPIYYGYGWSVDEINDVPTIEHGGGIFGYTTYGIYIPGEEVYVAVLTNSNGNSPTDVSVRIAAHAIGKPFPDNKSAATLTAEQMKKWTGTYEFDGGIVRFITYEDGTLYSQREGSGKMRLMAVSPTDFQFENSFSAYKFGMESGKKVANFSSRIRSGKGMISDRKPPAEKEAIAVAPEILATYTGKYELQPGFVIEVTTEEDKIYAQATGQPRAELFGESEDTFFLRVVNAKMVFNKTEDGSVASLTLHQGGQEMEAKKLH